jgi:hypothetical protein
MPPLLALFSWPLVVLGLARRFSPALAFILAILVGHLLLPEIIEFDLPLLPALNKYSIPALSVLLFIALFQLRPGARSDRRLIPDHGFVRTATIGLLLSTLVTVATNGDPLLYGPTFLPGMRLYDGLSQGLSMLIMLLPMLLARKFLAKPETHVLLLKVLCTAALCYSLPALFEVRMSPQLNHWIYGFFPHSWIQHYRGGGTWRPVVFMSHGLVLSIFFCCMILAAAGLSRLQRQKQNFFLMATFWLFMTLVLTKSLGALAIAVLLLPAVFLLGTLGQLMVAGAIATLVLIYPIARSSGIIPIQAIAYQAERIDPLRAGSFLIRVENENRILAKAQERPLFGWGAWGRSRVFDSDTGIDITIADGRWTGVLGVGGWVRYLLEFGLLCLPVCLLLLKCRQYAIGMETSVLALMLAANLIDLIPNSGLTPITWMIAGALWGRLELGRIDMKAGTEPVSTAKRRGPRYSRSDDPDDAPHAATERPRHRFTRQNSGQAPRRSREHPQ